MDNARINGVEKVERLDAEQLHNREPHLSDKAVGALLANTTVMVDPFEVAIAFMENAMQNGVELGLCQKVRKIENVLKKTLLYTHRISSMKPALLSMRQVYMPMMLQRWQEFMNIR